MQLEDLNKKARHTIQVLSDFLLLQPADQEDDRPNSLVRGGWRLPLQDVLNPRLCGSNVWVRQAFAVVDPGKDRHPLGDGPLPGPTLRVLPAEGLRRFAPWPTVQDPYS